MDIDAGTTTRLRFISRQSEMSAWYVQPCDMREVRSTFRSRIRRTISIQVVEDRLMRKTEKETYVVAGGWIALLRLA